LIELPAMPPEKQMRNYGLKLKDQKFRYETLPENFKLLDYDTQYEVFEQIVDYVGIIAAGEQCQQNVHDANLLHENLVAQASFIEAGQVIRGVA